MKKIIYIFIFTPFFVLAQVGINTTTPQETLDVEGTLRIGNTTSCMPNKISGTNGNGVLTDVVVGNNLELTGNVLNSTATGSAYYFVATISLPGNLSNEVYNNLDLDLLGANASKTLFRLIDRTASYHITGISGGTDGRHIVLYNVSASNLKIYDQDARSLASNRIITLNGGFVGTSGEGTAELVYDGAQSRWILIGFRD